MIKPLQVYLDSSDLDRLEKLAKEHSWTKSQTIRIALRVLTRDPEEDSLLSASGMIDSLPDDLSKHIDSYLEETFVAEKRSRYRKTGRKK
jgi:hypothetical protein